MFWKRKTPFTVTVHVNGRHPYLKTHELDFPSRDVKMVVNATSWNDAANQAVRAAIPIQGWSYGVKSIQRGLEEAES